VLWAFNAIASLDATLFPLPKPQITRKWPFHKEVAKKIAEKMNEFHKRRMYMRQRRVRCCRQRRVGIMLLGWCGE
jgi:hypothetical protein